MSLIGSNSIDNSIVWSLPNRHLSFCVFILFIMLLSGFNLSANVCRTNGVANELRAPNEDEAVGVSWSPSLPLDALNSPYDDFAPMVDKFTNSILFNSDRPKLGKKKVFGCYRAGFPSTIRTKLNSLGEYKEIIENVQKRMINIEIKPYSLRSATNANYTCLYPTSVIDYERYFAVLRKEPKQKVSVLARTTISGGVESEPIILDETMEGVNIAGTFANHPSISLSGKTLAFTSNRKGGEGGTDIWISSRTVGGWNTPVNLGEQINSPGNEITPYLQGDDTLYFSSDGLGGKGGYELFMTTKVAGVWQAPIPIYELNTPYNESDFRLVADDVALFCSDRLNQGLDIFYTSKESLTKSNSFGYNQFHQSALLPFIFFNNGSSELARNTTFNTTQDENINQLKNHLKNVGGRIEILLYTSSKNQPLLQSREKTLRRLFESDEIKNSQNPTTITFSSREPVTANSLLNDIAIILHDKGKLYCTITLKDEANKTNRLSMYVPIDIEFSRNIFPLMIEQLRGSFMDGSIEIESVKILYSDDNKSRQEAIGLLSKTIQESWIQRLTIVEKNTIENKVISSLAGGVFAEIVFELR